MDVRNCRQCGRLYNYIGGSMYNLCPDCIDKLEKKFTFLLRSILSRMRTRMPALSRLPRIAMLLLSSFSSGLEKKDLLSQRIRL